MVAPSKEADKSVVVVLDDSGDELRDLLDRTSTRRSAPSSRGSGGGYSAARGKSTPQRNYKHYKQFEKSALILTDTLKKTQVAFQ